MAITFLEKRKFQKNLIIVFLAVVLITIFVLWQTFFVKEKSPLEEVLVFQKKVEIDFETLEGSLLKKILLFEEIKPFEETALPEEKIGRGNPFLPY